MTRIGKLQLLAFERKDLEMKTRYGLLMTVGLTALLILTFWLLLESGAASANPAPSELPAGTIVGGNITTDTTWTLAGSPYILQTQNVTVIDNVKLTIEPGVTVEFNAARSLWVNGALHAVGTPTQPITFTRMAGATQPWEYLQIGGGNVLTDSNTSQISYATIEGGGSAYQMLYVYRSVPTLDHLTLRNSSTRGLYLSNLSTDSPVSWDTGTVSGNTGEGVYVATGRVALSNLTIAGNGGDGVELNSSDDSQLLNSSVQGNGGDGIRSSGSDRLLLEGLTIAGNTGYGIYVQFDGASGGVGSIVRDTSVEGNAVAARLHPDTLLENVTWTGNTRSEIEWIAGRINGRRTWARLPEISTYLVLGNITAPDNTRLTVEPGVTVQLQEYVSLYADGGLTAIGTPDQPIAFTELPGATHPWGMIQIGGGNVDGDSDDSRVSYATIEGGGTGNPGKLVYIYCSSASLDHVTVRNSSSDGIAVYPMAGTRVSLDTVAVTNNAGVAVYHEQPGPSLSYRHLTLQGNGTDAVSMARGSILVSMGWDFKDAGAPVRTSTLSVTGGTLALLPGTRLEFAANAGLEVWVNSSLYALGTPQDPITLTGVLSQPGAWKGVWLQPRSRAILRNCNIEYGGASSEPALKIQSPKSAIIVNSAVRHAAGDGVYVDAATPPVLSQNEVSGNAFGVRNTRTAVPVDARQVWWGDASGPYHASLNPGGLGNAVSDGVLFDPWLTEPPTPAATPSGLSVLLSGPRTASPGSRVTYGILFSNETEQTVSGAVLVADLPRDGAFAGASPGARYWEKRRHVFWQPGDLAPGDVQAFYLSVGFAWSIPPGTWESTLSGITGVPGGTPVFTAADYLNYSPEQLSGTQVLTAAELAGELAASPGLNQLYQSALAQEYLHGAAFRLSYVGAPPLVRIILLDFPNRRVMILQQQGTRLLATVAEPQAVVLSDTEGGDRYDLNTRQHGFFGEWASSAGRLNAACAPAEYSNFAGCMQNCIKDQVPEWILAYASAGASRALAAKDCYEAQATLEEGDLASCGASILDEIPAAGEYLDVIKCGDECAEDPTSHHCVEDKITCGCTGPTVLGGCWGQTNVETWECDMETHQYGLGPKWTTGCPINRDYPTKCVEGRGCVHESEAPRDISLLEIVAGHDPNAKYGPEGDLVPGQLVTYTITYENEGAGEAYGVFVVDELSEGFDLATLTLHGDADFVEQTRQIFWYVGELAPKGQPGSSGVVSFTVRLKDDLPSGTVVYNQAAVHFPSVPEVTPTNPVVNLVAPLAAVPQHVEVDAGSSVNIHLSGREASNAPLTFAIARKPLYGELSGNPPDITYTPMSGFVGQDSFSFTASNAITVSQPADVRILVNPSSDDLEPPTVTWVQPADGSQTVPISASPLFTGTVGPVYGPELLADFSESMDAGTVTTSTIRLSDQAGHDVGIAVFYDPAVRRVAIMPLERLAEGENYTVTIGSGVADAAGNPMAGDYVWTFRTAGGGIIYLPLVRKP
jgi:uncharacterized repeat protein (TIGR01451 family)